MIDLRTLVPLDTETILASVEKTGRLFTVEENPRLCGWGAELASIVGEEALLEPRRPGRPDHDAARATAPAAETLEDLRDPDPSIGSWKRSGAR